MLSLRFFTFNLESKGEKKKTKASSFSPSPPLSTRHMENHLLRHGEAMEAELKAMGAVQLGVRRWRTREREKERLKMMSNEAIDRCDRSLPLERASKVRSPTAPSIFFHSSVSA